MPGDYQERQANANADATAHFKPPINQETVIREQEDNDFDSKASGDEAASTNTPEWYVRRHSTT